MEQFKADEEENYPLKFPDTNFDVIALAASAGGLNALSAVFSQLPLEFPAALLVVQHLDRKYPSLMADIMSRRTLLQVKNAQAGEAFQPGYIYIAQPNYLSLYPYLVQTGSISCPKKGLGTLFSRCLKILSQIYWKHKMSKS